MTDTTAADDTLLSAALWLCRHHGIERSRASLLSPLGLESPLNTATVQQVLREAGFQTSLVQRDPAQVLALLLPVVVLLQDGQACVLVAREERESGLHFRILLPTVDGAAPVERWLDAAEMQAQCSGQVLIAMPALAAGPDGEGATGPAGQHPDAGHWLWQTLRRYVPYYRGAMLAAMLSNVLMLFTGLFTSVVYDRVIPHQAMTTLWALAIGATMAVAFDLAARQLRSHLIDHAGRKADLALGAVSIVDAPQLIQLIRSSVRDGKPLTQVWRIQRDGVTLALQITPRLAPETRASVVRGGWAQWKQAVWVFEFRCLDD